LFRVTSEGVVTLIPDVADLVHRHENTCK
jgi:hypothetical protein